MKSVGTPVTCINKRGHKLFGMLHEPEGRSNGPAIILLSPGIKNRVAPHRMYVKMAERFCSLGFIVLRMDPEGLGDSEGDIDQALNADVYASIQLGCYIEDTIVMMDWMEKKVGTSRFILSGLCGGAITALLSGEKDSRVHAILALGIPCVMASSTIDPLKYMSRKQFDSIREKYLRKVLNPQAWVRLLSFKSDYKLLTKSLLQPFKQWNDNKWYPFFKNSRKTNPDAQINTNLNPHFHRTFCHFISDKKIMLIFSGADRLYWEFEEKYLNIYRAEVTPFAENYQIKIVPEANHVFSFTEWQNQMLVLSENWLREL